ERHGVPLDGNVDDAERADRLRLAVLEHLEILFGQAADEVAVAIEDQRVDLDVLDLRLERRLLLRRRRRWLLSADDRGGEDDRRSEEAKACGHMCISLDSSRDIIRRRRRIKHWHLRR